MLHLDGFDGPLDLLLELAERQRVDLGRISVSDLVGQFLAALAAMADQTPIERRAEWVVVAARLLHLRSRLLFPTSPEEAAAAAQDEAAEVARIATLAAMRAAALWLDDRPKLGHEVFVRPHVPEQRPTGYVALMEACLAVLRGRGGHAADTPVYRPTFDDDLWRVADALTLIRARIIAFPQGAALRCFLPNLTPDRPSYVRAAVASTLVASLELARAGEVGLEQMEPCAEILVFARTA
jgi:segregation and condensation protein A